MDDVQVGTGQRRGSCDTALFAPRFRATPIAARRRVQVYEEFERLHFQPRHDPHDVRQREIALSPLYPSDVAFQHVHFLFETNDFDRPTIRVAVPSMSYGEAWNSKFSILMS